MTTRRIIHSCFVILIIGALTFFLMGDTGGARHSAAPGPVTSVLSLPAPAVDPPPIPVVTSPVVTAPPPALVVASPSHPAPPPRPAPPMVVTTVPAVTVPAVTVPPTPITVSPVAPVAPYTQIVPGARWTCIPITVTVDPAGSGGASGWVPGIVSELMAITHHSMVINYAPVNQYRYPSTGEIIIAWHAIMGQPFMPSSEGGFGGPVWHTTGQLDAGFVEMRPGSGLSVLRHEFGHALGLDHTTNRGDVMYPYPLTLDYSATDRAGLIHEAGC